MRLKLVLLLLMLLPFANHAQEKAVFFFDFNKDVLNQESAKKMEKWIDENANAEVTKIHGFCDSVDDKSYNKELSLKRITAIINMMKEGHIQMSENIELKPYGKEFKQSKNQDENRKVIVYYKLNKPTTLTAEEEIPTTGNLALKIEKERKSLASKFKNAKTGDIITIDNIYFYFNSERVVEKSRPILLELYNILAANPSLKIKINGHICCNTDKTDIKLSFKRAQYIYAYLAQKEILAYRIAIQGFGSSKPIFPIVEKTEAERIANRRVEIEIIQT